jgi:non-lysosomal glucosylceramidase
MRAPTSNLDGPHIAMPLGGIGTGNVAICADGALRQWQLHNLGNHAGDLPGSFFALRVTRIEPPLDVTRILQAVPPAQSTNTPLVDDDFVPAWQRRAVHDFGGVSGTEFGGTYPFATVRYLDPALPVDVALEAFTPLVPLDAERSSIPAALFTFTISNPGTIAVHGNLGAALQNAVGWNGYSPIDGVNGAGYGGNTNRVHRSLQKSGHGWTALVLENSSLAPDDPGAGQMVLAADDDRAPALAQWRTIDEFMTFLSSRAPASGAGRIGPGSRVADGQRQARPPHVGASPPGSTWNTGIAVPFALQPGESRRIRIVICWSFPNRYVNFEQFGPDRPEWGQSRFWLGNHYSTRYADAQDVLRRVSAEFDDLRAASLSWSDTLAESTLDDQAVRHLAAQLSLPRSPTCFQGADGRFYGFEGVLGASTVMWSGEFGGSCPLNCTHVWNYEQVLSRAFPTLSRDMRATEFEIMQAPEGYIPHRLIAPTYLRQLWGDFVGGPGEPALDGMLGAVLKTYREYRNGAGLEWLARYWPHVQRLMGYIARTWDPTDSGVLTGVQPSTHDIDLAGLNTYTGTLWLAALRAASEMASFLGDVGSVDYQETFHKGSARYDAELFNGEYYIQKLLPGDRGEFQWRTGCLSDQLIGQWWAHQLGLGYLLPPDHVRSALAAVVKYNFRKGFRDFEHPYRVFADGDDAGLVMCSWPHGGRVEVPTRYADEVWTGIEYQVAAHCFWEDMTAQGWQLLRAVWDRYDGRRRNPFNEIECGDHYARAMAGWSVVDALAGLRYDANTGSLSVRRVDGTLPVLLGEGWGLITGTPTGVRLEFRGGRINLAGGAISAGQTVMLDGEE